MDALVVTTRHTCCMGLAPEESKTVRILDVKDVWLQSVAALEPDQYDAHVEGMFEKLRAKSGILIICTDVMPALAMKIAYVAGMHNHKNIYLLHQNGDLYKI